MIASKHGEAEPRLKSQSAPCFASAAQEAGDHQERHEAGEQEQMRGPEVDVEIGERPGAKWLRERQ